MPKSFYKDLLTSLQEFKKNNRKGENSKLISDLENDLIEINLNLTSDSNREYSKSELESLSKVYDSYIKNCNEFLKTNINPTLKAKFNTSLIPINSSLNKMNEAKLDESNTHKIFDSADWIKDVFNMQEKAPKNNEVLPSYSLENKSINDIANEYKETTNDLPNNFKTHIGKVVNSNDSPMETLNAKLNLLQSFIEEHIDESKLVVKSNEYRDQIKKKINLSTFNNAYRTISHDLDTKNLYNLSSQTIISSDYFQYSVEDRMPFTNIRGEISELNISENEKTDLTNALLSLELRPEHIGLDREKMNKLNSLSKPLRIFESTFKGLYMGYPNEQPKMDHPYYNLFLTGHKIENEMANLVRTGMTTIDEAKINEFADELSRLALNNSVFMDNSSDFNPYSFDTRNAFIELSNAFPSLKEKYNTFNDLYKEKIKSEFDLAYRDIAEKDIYDSLVVPYNRAEELYNKGFATSDDFNKVYLTRFLRESSFRKSEIERAETAISEFSSFDGIRNSQGFSQIIPGTDEKISKEELHKNVIEKLLIGKLVESEFEKALAFSNSRRTTYDLAFNRPNQNLHNAFSGQPLNEEGISNFEKYINGLKNSDGFKELINKTPSEISEFLSKENAIKVLQDTIKTPDEKIFDNLFTDEEKSALTQASAALNMKNSPSYNAIAEKIIDLQDKLATPGATKKEDYIGLYDTLRNYVYTHDSKPTFDNGKLRFDKAASVMRKLGTELKGISLELDSKIEKDFKATSIRSKNFRDDLINDARNRLSKVNEDLGGLTREKFDNLKTPEERKQILDDITTLFETHMTNELLSRNGKAMITGKMDKESKVTSLLNGFKITSSSAIKSLDTAMLNLEEALPILLSPEKLNNATKKTVDLMAQKTNGSKTKEVENEVKKIDNINIIV